MKYVLETTWDNRIPDDAPQIFIGIKPKQKDGIEVKVDAPFYDDPKLPPHLESKPGRVDGLWDYEVVEVFFLGENLKYLEVELGPKGHFLVYSLQGRRNVTEHDLMLEQYSANIYKSSESGEQRWRGDAFIPFQFLPPNLTSWNAYAIHKSETDRRYMSLFPVPQGKFNAPDFHRLEYFQPIEINFE